MKPPVLSPRLAFPATVAATVAACALLALAAGPARAASSSASTSASSSASPATDGAAPVPAQRTRMKTCNAEAHDKHGAERRAFMKQCLSKKGAASAAG